MASALIVSSNSPGAPDLAADLPTVGFSVVAAAVDADLVREAVRAAPDIVVCCAQYPTDAFFRSTESLATTAPRPVIVFTSDPDAEKIARATRAGVHAYVVNGYALHRLRPVIFLAQARFAHEAELRGELSDLAQRFDERKLVDRAKGILMRAHRISEDQAFRALRTAAMHSKQRVGQVAQQIIEEARYAEAVNRAGQVRMLSQRIVALYALICLGGEAAEAPARLREAQENVAGILAGLGRTLSRATFGDLLDAVTRPWTALRTVLKKAPAADRLAAVDILAEDMLQQAEQLVMNLEIAGLSQSLHVINVAGRQRMLSQRLAKQALLAARPGGDEAVLAAAARTSRESFLAAFEYLNAIPLKTPEIAEALAAAERVAAAFHPALRRADTPEGRTEISALSEQLLALFDRLTERYELGMQMLMK
jgi:AmiR/NasT family two-component response regulator